MTAQSTCPRRLVVGVTGSSAPQLAVTMMTVLSRIDSVETHLVITSGAGRTLELEAGVRAAHLAELADVSYDPHDYAASISSGSFRTIGMAIVPCSMSTLGSIAHGVSSSLVSRAADVTLKERRPLVLVTRETPLNLIHLRNMVAVTEAGATVLPPVPAFYHRPTSIDDLLLHTCGKVLDQFDIPHDLYQRWKSPDS